jgi:hypothetical protein
MNRVGWYCVGLVVAGLALWGACLSLAPDQLPGIACPELPAEVRAGLLRGPCTDTGVQCFWDPLEAFVCAETATRGCVNPGTPCGSCTGANDEQCANTSEDYLCMHVFLDCCTTSDTCQSMYPGCNCANSGTATWVGTRVDC